MTTNHAARLADQLDRLARQDGRLHPHEIAACRDASRILRPTDDPEYRRAVDTEQAAAHNCATCEPCVHDGRRCCGCYDGACCQRGVKS